ncbi:MAG: hypothetical protein CMF62_02115 [Magnetococcales bacterium]|nr:hypothetical protein [Magnetococcales bacterium]
MYLAFLALTIYTYLFTFIIQSFSKYVFDSILNKKISGYIDQTIKKWILLNPHDEWIDVNKSEFKIKTQSEMIYVETDYKYSPEDDIYDDSDELEEIFNKMVIENYSSGSLVFVTVLMISLCKMFSGYGLFGELILGGLSGLIIHFLHFVYYLLLYSKNLYFNGKFNSDISKAITTTNKIKHKYLLLIPSVFITILSYVRMYNYSRVIGEWIVDINFIYLYVGILLGYYAIQTGIDIIQASKKTPALLFLATLYIIMGIFV